MAIKMKCAGCGKELVYFRQVLAMGPKGFRCYAFCDKCAEKVERKQKARRNAEGRNAEGRCVMDRKELGERVSWLINSSVEDLRSSLNFEDDQAVIREAMKVCKDRGEKTKAAMLERKLKKMEKERIRAVYLERLEEAFRETEDASDVYVS